MSTPHEAILSALDLPEGCRYSPEDAQNMAGALRDVLAIHKPYRVYDVDCGHQHTDEDIEAGTAMDITDVGYVCDDAYQYSICNACCTDDGYGQTEECVSRHPHGKDLPYCGTVRVIAEALGVSTEPAQPTRQPWVILASGLGDHVLSEVTDQAGEA